MFFRHTIMPLLLCIGIYLTLRDKVFLLISQENFPVLYQCLKAIQDYCMPLRSLPNWLLYSLPDGLWTYAFSSYFVFNFNRRPYTPKHLFYILLCPVLSISFEISQQFQGTPGTYDVDDLWCCVLGGMLPFFIQKISEINFYIKPIRSNPRRKSRRGQPLTRDKNKERRPNQAEAPA